jgi:hypothetical protein
MACRTCSSSLGFGGEAGALTAVVRLNRLKLSEYILAFSMLFPPVIDAIQGSMFNFQQSLRGSIVPIDRAVPQNSTASLT